MVAAAPRYPLDRLGWTHLSYSATAVLVLVAIGAVVDSLVYSRFPVVHLTNDSIHGPLEGFGTELRLRPASIRRTHRRGEALTVEGDDGNDIVIDLGEHPDAPTSSSTG